MRSCARWDGCWSRTDDCSSGPPLRAASGRPGTRWPPTCASWPVACVAPLAAPGGGRPARVGPSRSSNPSGRALGGSPGRGASGQPDPARRRTTSPSTSADELRRIARRTWHYFDTSVTETEHHLPPDNVPGDARAGGRHPHLPHQHRSLPALRGRRRRPRLDLGAARRCAGSSSRWPPSPRSPCSADISTTGTTPGSSPCLRPRTSPQSTAATSPGTSSPSPRPVASGPRVGNDPRAHLATVAEAGVRDSVSVLRRRPRRGRPPAPRGGTCRRARPHRQAARCRGCGPLRGEARTCWSG